MMLKLGIYLLWLMRCDILKYIPLFDYVIMMSQLHCDKKQKVGKTYCGYISRARQIIIMWSLYHLGKVCRL